MRRVLAVGTVAVLGAAAVAAIFGLWLGGLWLDARGGLVAEALVCSIVTVVACAVIGFFVWLIGNA